MSTVDRAFIEGIVDANLPVRLSGVSPDGRIGIDAARSLATRVGSGVLKSSRPTTSAILERLQITRPAPESPFDKTVVIPRFSAEECARYEYQELPTPLVNSVRLAVRPYMTDSTPSGVFLDASSLAMRVSYESPGISLHTTWDLMARRLQEFARDAADESHNEPVAPTLRTSLTAEILGRLSPPAFELVTLGVEATHQVTQAYLAEYTG